jgi:hypothetical protein
MFRRQSCARLLVGRQENSCALSRSQVFPALATTVPQSITITQLPPILRFSTATSKSDSSEPQKSWLTPTTYEKCFVLSIVRLVTDKKSMNRTPRRLPSSRRREHSESFPIEALISMRTSSAESRLLASSSHRKAQKGKILAIQKILLTHNPAATVFSTSLPMNSSTSSTLAPGADSTVA